MLPTIKNSTPCGPLDGLALTTTLEFARLMFFSSNAEMNVTLQILRISLKKILYLKSMIFKKCYLIKKQYNKSVISKKFLFNFRGFLILSNFRLEFK